jgi:hypothetical protein
VQPTSRRPNEFFAPLPLAAVALLVTNDVWLKPTFHSAVTGKLSDIAICFFMPLFLSELLGVALHRRPRGRLAAGAIITALLFTALEVIPPFTRLALRMLGSIGPPIGIAGPFRMTSDWTDLFCLALIPASVAYGWGRLRTNAYSAPSSGSR